MKYQTSKGEELKGNRLSGLDLTAVFCLLIKKQFLCLILFVCSAAMLFFLEAIKLLRGFSIAKEFHCTHAIIIIAENEILLNHLSEDLRWKILNFGEEPTESSSECQMSWKQDERS